MHLSRKGMAPTSLNRFLSSLRKFCSFLKSKVTKCQSWSLAVLRQDLSPRVVLRDDISKLLELPENTPIELRDKALVWFLLGTGTRISEALSLKVEDIDFRTASCQVLGKGNKKRTVYIPSKALKLLKRYIEVFNLTEGHFS